MAFNLGGYDLQNDETKNLDQQLRALERARRNPKKDHKRISKAKYEQELGKIAARLAPLLQSDNQVLKQEAQQLFFGTDGMIEAHEKWLLKTVAESVRNYHTLDNNGRQKLLSKLTNLSQVHGGLVDGKNNTAGFFVNNMNENQREDWSKKLTKQHKQQLVSENVQLEVNSDIARQKKLEAMQQRSKKRLKPQNLNRSKKMKSKSYNKLKNVNMDVQVSDPNKVQLDNDMDAFIKNQLGHDSNKRMAARSNAIHTASSSSVRHDNHRKSARNAMNQAMHNQIQNMQEYEPEQDNIKVESLLGPLPPQPDVSKAAKQQVENVDFEEFEAEMKKNYNEDFNDI